MDAGPSQVLQAQAETPSANANGFPSHAPYTVNAAAGPSNSDIPSASTAEASSSTQPYSTGYYPAPHNQQLVESPSIAASPYVLDPAATTSRIQLRPARPQPPKFNPLTAGTGLASPVRTRLRRDGQGVPRKADGSSELEEVKVVPKIRFKVGAKQDGDGRKSSFLGEYDRDLDENPDDPLAFEEQFILRVPGKISNGPNGLREVVKGKGKGLEGVEFKSFSVGLVVAEMNNLSRPY